MPRALERTRLGTIEDKLRYVNHRLRSSGMKPLSVSDIKRALDGEAVPRPINGAKRDMAVNPNTPDFTPDNRDAMMRSSVPMAGAIGPVQNPSQVTGEGASGMTGLYDDQAMLRAMRQPQNTMQFLAQGGDLMPGERAIVGERGPEFLDNRGGLARVTPMLPQPAIQRPVPMPMAFGPTLPIQAALRVPPPFMGMMLPSMAMGDPMGSPMLEQPMMPRAVPPPMPMLPPRAVGPMTPLMLPPQASPMAQPRQSFGQSTRRRKRRQESY